MSKNQDMEKKTKNAEKADDIAKEFTNDVVLAAEAMERAARYRRTLVVEETRYAYEKIF